MMLWKKEYVVERVGVWRHDQLVWLMLFLLLSRLVAMVWVPLNDSTEARYAEIARIMLETGNWITPMHQYGQPFWAKPPLSMWLSALSMKAFGVSAFSARLPGLLLSIGCLALVWHWAKEQGGRTFARHTLVILAGSLYFFLDAGTVMTDPSLLFCTTLSLTSFWFAVMRERRVWGVVFFLSLGLGLLAKGPVAWVLIGMPLFAFVVWQKKWRALWQQLPWLTGLALVTLIALPWYVLAEQHTPGFLQYFLIGEHVQRFLQPGWSGDKYGFAHRAPYGMIWVYLLVGTLPWSFLGGVWCVRHRERCRALFQHHDTTWLGFLALCTLLPIVFFTFASNIIYPYVFPSLPTFALLFATLMRNANIEVKRGFLLMASFCGSLFLLVTLLFCLAPQWVAKSQNRVIAAVKNEMPLLNTPLIYWRSKTEYSAQFYALGQVRATLHADTLRAWLSSVGVHYVVTDSEEPYALPDDLRAHLKKITSVMVSQKRYTIYRWENLRHVDNA